MRIHYRLFIFGLFLIFLLAGITGAASQELIKPTRTLQSSKTTPGKLSVFSEPPGLDVLLDGAEFGKTPVISKEVPSGVHKLQIKGIEKEIIIQPGKSIQWSFFKDSLTEIPEKEAETPAPPLEEKKPAEETKKEGAGKNMLQYDPFYWPQNPKGPIGGQSLSNCTRSRDCYLVT